MMTVDDVLAHHGILGMKWGVRRFQDYDGRRIGKSVEKAVYRVGAKLNPREARYKIQKVLNNPSADKEELANIAMTVAKGSGTLTTNQTALKAIETMGIENHSKAIYSNLTDKDLNNLKTYTDSARYSRNINSYLATGEPKNYAEDAENLKASLRKNRIDDQVVFRSCNLKFSVDGIAKKLETLSEQDLSLVFDQFSKNFSGKSRSENRVFSTSTSPLFAIDTWRKVNPTAASTYNTYMMINCKNVSGVYADGKTNKKKSLVNTGSNQECILAPSKLIYRKLAFDKSRGMFVITVDAIN